MTQETHRLYCKAKILGYQRGKNSQNPSTSLIQLENVNSKAETDFYLGKRVVYIYKGNKSINGTTIRTIWGKITRPHGNSGVVRAKFAHNLPTTSFGRPVRVMLYPSRV